MKHTRLLLAFLVLTHLLLGTVDSRAQSVDLSFYPTELYRPADAQDVLALSTGDRLILSTDSRRADGQPASGLARYSAAGVLDAAFTGAVAGLRWSPVAVAEDAAGRILVANQGEAQLGTQRFGCVLRLLPSGAVDASFAAQPVVTGTISGLLVQADGKIVLTGTFRQFGAQATAGLARLNTDGSLDQGFMTALNGGLGAQTFTPRIALQPDGKLLVGGSFSTVAGQPRRALARLNTDGSLDASFAPPVTSNALVGTLAVQPDGKILVGTFNGTRLFTGSPLLVRLTSAGALDASFTAPTSSVSMLRTPGRSLAVLPDGSMLLIVYSSLQGRVVHLSASGGLVPGWNVPSSPNQPLLNSLAPLPNGQVLIAGPAQYTAATGPARGVSLLNADGSYNASFTPSVQMAGVVHDVAVQADGKLVIIGDFDELNGAAVRNLARLQPDGTLDAAFSAQSQLLGGMPNPYELSQVLIQPDGKIVVGGEFSSVGTVARPLVARLLPSGQVDLSFVAPFRANTATSSYSVVTSLTLQPDGKLIVTGAFASTSGAMQTMVRLDGATGQVDATFQPPVIDSPIGVVVQPDGKLVVASLYGPPLVQRLQPNGAPDASFTSPTSSDPTAFVYGLERYANGQLMLYGDFPDLNGLMTPGVARLQANGTPDPAFLSGIPGVRSIVSAATIQPNQRILTGYYDWGGGVANPVKLARVQPGGGMDVAFTPLATNSFQFINRVLVQPDGGIIVAGGFEQLGNSPRMGIARVLDANVLAVRAGQSEAALGAWPVPARTELHLRLEAAARPQRVQLLDALGRSVRTLAHPAADATLDVRGLPAGSYLLRVEYADGPATRRVVVE